MTSAEDATGVWKRPWGAAAGGSAGADAASASALAAALDHAGRFVAHLSGCSVEDWRDVLQRARAVDAAVHGAALRRVAALVEAYPDAGALAALQDAACAAAPTEAAAGAGSRASCSLAGRLAMHAAIALALRDALSAAEFAALYAPFARPTLFDPGDPGGGSIERRTRVTALRTVAAPLAPPAAGER
jgi:hypothetical protein